MIVWLVAAAFASENVGLSPIVHLSVKNGVGMLRVEAPAGKKVAPDAPVRVSLVGELREGNAFGAGADLVRGLPLAVGAGTQSGELSLGLCAADGTNCQLVAYALSGEIVSEKRARLTLSVDAPSAPEPAAKATVVGPLDVRLQGARAAGKPVLLDFGAVWCPPCNQLEAEVLHDVDVPPALEAVSVIGVDVDRAESFALKAKYAVTGYPTLVLTDAEGVELDRMVGYSGKDAFLAWLSAATANPPLPIDAPAEQLTPSDAAGVALRRAERGLDAAAWIARAETKPELAEQLSLRLARFLEAPTKADGEWLLAYDGADLPLMRWVFAADQMDKPDAAFVAALRERLLKGAVRAQGPEVGDLWWGYAEMSPEGESRRLAYAAGASALGAALSGDRVHDKPYITGLAQLRERAGDAESALALLDEWTAALPEEPTFWLAAGATALRAKDAEGALMRAQQGLTSSWGDNALRMAKLACEAYVALERPREAAALADRLLAEQPAPAAELDVRTHRYREQLAAFLGPEKAGPG